MDIYLDTSHLQKWQQKTLSCKELSALNKLKKSGQHRFVLSLVHVVDISDRADNKKAIEVAKFLDDLPKIWLRNPVDLKREEIKNAIRCFNNQQSPVNPFVTDFVDTLELVPTTALTIALQVRGSSIETVMTNLLTPTAAQQSSLPINHLQQWVHNNSIIISKESNTQKKNKKMQENLRRVLKDNIRELKLSNEVIEIVVTKLNRIVDPIDEFISWLIQHPCLIASIWCPYYTQHFMHRNTTLIWEKSDIEDLLHLAAIPYVSFISVDKQTYNYAKQALKFVKRHIPQSWENRITTSVLDIRD